MQLILLLITLFLVAYERDTKDCPGCSPTPVLLPAIHNMYLFLSEYDPGGWKYYDSNIYIATFSISELQSISLEYPQWPLTTPSLKSMYSENGKYAELILELTDDQVGLLDKGTIEHKYYVENNFRALVSYRQIWPHEIDESNKFYGALSKKNIEDILDLPTDPIECKKTDGVYDLPPLSSP